MGDDGLCPSFAAQTPIVFGFAEKGSNPFLFQQKNIEHYLAVTPSIFGGEQGIRTLEAVLATYTISNRAPSTSSDNSPYVNYDIIH